MLQKIAQQIADRVFVKIARAPLPQADVPMRPLGEGVPLSAGILGGSGALLGKLQSVTANAPRPRAGFIGGALGGVALGSGLAVLQNYLRNRAVERQRTAAL